MNDIGDAFCPNNECKDCGLQSHGNITVRGKYGNGKTKDLLYCRTICKRLASSRATARLLGIITVLHGGSGFQPRILQYHRAVVVYRGWKPLPQR